MKIQKGNPVFSGFPFFVNTRRVADFGLADFSLWLSGRSVAREAAGLSQKELANRLKTKKTAISRIENHAEDIRLSTLEKVPAAIELSYGYDAVGDVTAVTSCI